MAKALHVVGVMGTAVAARHDVISHEHFCALALNACTAISLDHEIS